MKKIHVIIIEIVAPEPGTMGDAEGVVNSLINALRDGKCQDAYYRMYDRYLQEQYTITLVDENGATPAHQALMDEIWKMYNDNRPLVNAVMINRIIGKHLPFILEESANDT